MLSTPTSAESGAAAAAPPILTVSDLAIQFKLPQGWVTAVDGVGFECGAARSLGIVGESGSGKSQILLAPHGPARRQRPVPPAARCFEGREILNRGRRELDAMRGSAMAMIFQDPMTSLNPVHAGQRPADRGADGAPGHRPRRGARHRRRACSSACASPRPRRRIRLYPHEFSGGMRQRVMIAMALLCRAGAAVRRRADHGARRHRAGADPGAAGRPRARPQRRDRPSSPTTSASSPRLCDRVIVLYGGRIMEQATIDEIFYDPRHPYTAGPARLDAARSTTTSTAICATIPGQPRAADGRSGRLPVRAALPADSRTLQCRTAGLLRRAAVCGRAARLPLRASCRHERRPAVGARSERRISRSARGLLGRYGRHR